MDVSTLGLVTVKFGDGFYPPTTDSLDRISLQIELAIRPNEETPDLSKLQFLWELINFDYKEGLMLIQVNFTNAVWVSA